MNKLEICINKDELENCNGNLKLLEEIWEGAFSPNSLGVEQSEGYTADLIERCIRCSGESRIALKNMLHSSVLRYEALDVTFEDVQRVTKDYMCNVGNVRG